MSNMDGLILVFGLMTNGNGLYLGEEIGLSGRNLWWLSCLNNYKE